MNLIHLCKGLKKEDYKIYVSLRTHLCFSDLDVSELLDFVPKPVCSLPGDGELLTSGSSFLQLCGLLLLNVSLETGSLKSSNVGSGFVSFAADRLLVLPVFFKASSPEKAYYSQE